MADFWEYPTVSMGLGPLAAVMHARFWKYLHNRGLADTSESTVFAFLGDGEMDEPESIAAIAVAGREKLDNLITIVNCNLQRLDGPVRGNSKIVQELEGLYRGAGWDVFKVLWDSNWDRIFSQDRDGILLARLEEITDGDFQRMSTLESAEFRNELFSGNSALVEMGQKISDQEIGQLRRGGHDPIKVWSAYHAAKQSDRPAVILAHTVKGWGIDSFEARNTTHQKKKMSLEDLKQYRDDLGVTVDDENLENDPFHEFEEDSDTLHIFTKEGMHWADIFLVAFLQLSMRPYPVTRLTRPSMRGLQRGKKFYNHGVRSPLEKPNEIEIGEKVVPIIPDEGRTFGMDPLFSEFGIYSSFGQLYTPVDHKMLMNYKESTSGQILEEGISEANSIASWIASATSIHTPELQLYHSTYSTRCLDSSASTTRFGLRQMLERAAS